MFTLKNEITGELRAERFDTWARASEFSQNFGPEWIVHEIGTQRTTTIREAV